MCLSVSYGQGIQSLHKWESSEENFSNKKKWWNVLFPGLVKVREENFDQGKKKWWNVLFYFGIRLPLKAWFQWIYLKFAFGLSFRRVETHSKSASTVDIAEKAQFPCTCVQQVCKYVDRKGSVSMHLCTASRCCTRGESEDYKDEKACKGSPWLWNRGLITVLYLYVFSVLKPYKLCFLNAAICS